MLLVVRCLLYVVGVCAYCLLFVALCVSCAVVIFDRVYLLYVVGCWLLCVLGVVVC